MSTIERSCNAVEACLHFENEIKRLHLTPSITTIRDSTILSGYQCILTAKKFSEGFVGLGEGFGKQAMLSAQFEALEHFTSMPSLTHHSVVEFLSPKEIQEKQLPVLEHKLPIGFFEKNNNYDCSLPCVLLRHIANPDKLQYLPLVCVSPIYLDFLYERDQFLYELVYLHQAANGVAIGNNLTEALIHAINEVVERAALSLFIRQVFFEGQQVNLVDNTSLPKRISEIVSLIQEESNYQCFIVKISSQVDVPVYAAFLVSSRLKMPIQGMGCSLDEYHALERAVLEMVEQYDAYEMSVREEQESALEDLREYPHLYKCAQFDLEEIFKIRKFNITKFSASSSSWSNAESYLKELIARVTCSYDIFTTILYNKSQNVTTVKVVLPQASDLFMITKGILPPEAL